MSEKPNEPDSGGLSRRAVLKVGLQTGVGAGFATGIAAGFALAVRPISAQTIRTPDTGLVMGDFTVTRGIAFQQDAVGIAVKMDIATESERDISRQDFLFVTKMLSGGGSLRAEAAVELIDDA